MKLSIHILSGGMCYKISMKCLLYTRLCFKHIALGRLIYLPYESDLIK